MTVNVFCVVGAGGTQIPLDNVRATLVKTLETPIPELYFGVADSTIVALDHHDVGLYPSDNLAVVGPTFGNALPCYESLTELLNIYAGGRVFAVFGSLGNEAISKRLARRVFVIENRNVWSDNPAWVSSNLMKNYKKTSQFSALNFDCFLTIWEKK